MEQSRFYAIYLLGLTESKIKKLPRVFKNVRGVLGNKCAGQHNLKTVQIREIV
jgi:hypothetical protein